MNNGGIIELRKKYKEEKTEKKSKKEIISKISRKIVVEPKDSNEILVYCGTYRVKKYSNGIAREYLTYETNLNATYNLYMDIETYEIYKVEMDKIYSFEEKYPVLRIPVKFNNYQEYLNNFESVRNKFLEELINSSQDKAVKKVLEYKKNNLSVE